MSDLRSRLDRFAERGEHRGAAMVYRRAKAQMDEVLQQPVSNSLSHVDGASSGRWRKVAVLVVALSLVVAAVLVEANRGGPGHVIVARPATTEQALATQQSAKLVWVDGRGVEEGDPKTGRQVRLAGETGACQTCSGVRMGRYLFLTQPRVVRVDTADGSIEDLGPGLFAFPHPDGASLYVVLTAEATAKTTATTIASIDVDGHRLGGPWMLPAGQTLVNPPRAVVGGVLTQSNQNAADHTLSVWNPTTGRLSRVGRSRDVIDTYTAPGAPSSLVAYTAAGCRTTGCGLTIARIPGGTSRRIAAPDGAPGFIGGGGFSPDGEQLAVFVDRIPEAVNPHGELVIVTLATGVATPITASTVSFGEPFGFATWSPDGNWVYFGGLSNQLMAHYRDAPDAAPLPLPAYYSAVAVAPNSTLSPTTMRHKTDALRLVFTRTAPDGITIAARAGLVPTAESAECPVVPVPRGHHDQFCSNARAPGVEFQYAADGHVYRATVLDHDIPPASGPSLAPMITLALIRTVRSNGVTVLSTGKLAPYLVVLHAADISKVRVNPSRTTANGRDEMVPVHGWVAFAAHSAAGSIPGGPFEIRVEGLDSTGKVVTTALPWRCC